MGEVGHIRWTHGCAMGGCRPGPLKWEELVVRMTELLGPTVGEGRMKSWRLAGLNF